MSVSYYFFNLLRVYEDENDCFYATGCLSTWQCPITKEGKILIKNLFTLEGYNAKRVSWHKWSIGVVNKFLEKLCVTGSVGRRPSIGRRCSASTADNIDLVYELVLHTMMSRREIIFAHCTQ